ncbi:MAG: AAA family ATPase [bacterium]|nr:AAA family ATPase [bacterium]
MRDRAVDESITLLHLSDIQFGRSHRFGSGEPSETLAETLAEDLTSLAEDHDLQPDLVVVTGDLASWGRHSEFDEALHFLEEIERLLGLRRGRTIVIPGNHDVNFKASEAYFRQCEADEREPDPPYWPKWQGYARFFRHFYRDVAGADFTEEKPWTLFQVPELKVVVAGLNSTMAESHRESDHVGFLGERQLVWFADKLRPFRDKEWMRIGVVHHNPIRAAADDCDNLRDADDLERILGPFLHLILHGHTHDRKLQWLNPRLPVLSSGSAALRPEARAKEVPNQYQILQIGHDRLHRWARCYAPERKRWIGDTRISRAGDSWHAEHPLVFDQVMGVPSDTPSPSRRQARTRELAPPPSIPSELIRACRERESVFYAGAGLSAQAGFPTWRAFVEVLLRLASRHHAISPDFEESLTASLAEHETDLVADSVVNAFMESHQMELLHEELEDLFLRPAELSPTHRILKEIGFTAALTTNFDELLERTFTRAPVFTPADAGAVLEHLNKRKFFLLKLYGDLRTPGTVMIAPARYDEVVAGNREFANFMETLFYSRTLLFVGASLEGISTYLRGIELPRVLSRTHYALVDVDGQTWKPRARSLERRYGIRVLPFTASIGYPELHDFLDELRRQVSGSRPEDTTHGYRVGATDEVSVGSEPERLERLIIENIGPFHELELGFHPRWNILLGNNGIGKSTVLKAIALAITGQDGERWADRLLRTGASSGEIILETGSRTYRTTIRKLTRGAEVTSYPARPLEDQGWLAIGFPPLRTVNWERPRAPEPVTRGRPSPEDLLPLLRGARDPRLGGLKQWLVNLDYRIKDELVRNGKGDVYQALLDRFFELISQLTEGLTVRFRGIDPQTHEIRLVTDDGEVPFEAVSQGTTSLMGWTGILLSRLYEVSDSDSDPTRDHALVLLDELDAHLHPSWQHQLVPQLAKIFPNVQFVATTHSPLIVVGMPPEQIIHLEREADGNVLKKTVNAEMTVGRTDQILTGGLFGLATTLDSATQEGMERYAELMGRSDRSDEEEEELGRLRESLRFRIPLSLEQPVERQALALLHALLQAQAGDLFPEAQAEAMMAAEKLIHSLLRKKGLSI